MLVIPYSGESGEELPEEIKAVFDEIYEEAGLEEKQTLMGSHADIFGEHMNGAATDWVMSQTGIIAMSPRLGSADALSVAPDLEAAHEASVIAENMDLPLHLLDRANALLRLTRRGAKSDPTGGLKLHVAGGKARFALEVANSGMSDITEEFRLTVSFTDGWTTHEQCFMAPALASRERKTFRISFNNVSTDTLARLWEVQETEPVAGRVGLYLDIELGDEASASSLGAKLGWAKSNERIYFPLGTDSFSTYSIPGTVDTIGRWTIADTPPAPPSALSLLASSSDSDVIDIPAVTPDKLYSAATIASLGMAAIIGLLVVAVRLLCRLCPRRSDAYARDASDKQFDFVVI